MRVLVVAGTVREFLDWRKDHNDIKLTEIWPILTGGQYGQRNESDVMRRLQAMGKLDIAAGDETHYVGTFRQGQNWSMIRTKLTQWKVPLNSIHRDREVHS